MKFLKCMILPFALILNLGCSSPPQAAQVPGIAAALDEPADVPDMAPPAAAPDMTQALEAPPAPAVATQGPAMTVDEFLALPTGSKVWLVNYVPTYDTGTAVYPVEPNFDREYTLRNFNIADDGTRSDVGPDLPANWWELYDDADLDTAIWGILPCGTGAEPMTDCAHGEQIVRFYEVALQ